MRIHPMALLGIALLTAACTDRTGPPTDGILLVSTSTGGREPDQDGYLLAIDTADSVSLEPIGTVAIRLVPGRHALRLLDVADQCAVTSAPVLEVDVPSGDTLPVGFDISCSPAGALITITTTGLDLPFDGYRLVIDGAQQGHSDPNSTLLTPLEPGSRTIALTGLAPNCTITGPASRTVTVVDTEIVPVDFAVACTATSGVVEFVIDASGPLVYESFEAMLDRAPVTIWGISAIPEPLLAGLGQQDLSGVQGGDHVITLLDSPHCSVETGPQSVSVAVGGLVRDTVAVHFSVTCSLPPKGAGTLRISAPTTGSTPPSTRYTVWYEGSDYWDPGSSPYVFLNTLGPNGTLVTDVAKSGFDPAIYWYSFKLGGVPANCSVRSPTRPPSTPYDNAFTVRSGDTLDLVFAVTCTP